jgi:hypothetical protein
MGAVRNLYVSKLVAAILLLSLLLGGVGGVFAAADATTTPTIDVSPTPDVIPTTPPNVLAFVFYPSDKHSGDYFDPTIKPGETAKLKVIIGNSGTVPFEARTYKINAATAENGGFRAAQAGTEPTGVTNWVDYPEDTFTIDVGKGVERNFSITVPKGTKPGQYLTALAVETAEARAVEGTDALKQIIRQALPVFITVPGKLTPKFDVGDITLTPVDNGSALTIGIVNTGNVRVRPTGTITLSDSTGATLLTAPVAMDSVYAHDQTTLSIGAPPLLPGNYTVSVDLSDPDTGAKASVSNVTVTAQAPATPLPPPPVGFGQITATPQPSLDKIQFLDLSVTVSNNGEPITNAQLVLSASRNGKSVEDYPLASSLAVPTGNTVVQSRYIPATGWKSGTWTFILTLKTVDPSSGVAVVIASTDLGEPIVVP